MRCFPLPKAAVDDYHSLENNEPHPIQSWLNDHKYTHFQLSNIQQQALAQLIPLLLCGEQSAVHVFNCEYQRIRDKENSTLDDFSEAMLDLQAIEADERLHEQALQFILQQLPKSINEHKIKRVAQRFYADIQQYSQSVAQHFLLISQLDACVCILMNTVAKSSICSTSLADLFHLIKKDEARHVSIASRHAKLLSSNKSEQQWVNECDVQHRLVKLLNSHAQPFVDLDIDTTALFNRLINSSINKSDI